MLFVEVLGCHAEQVKTLKQLSRAETQRRGENQNGNGFAGNPKSKYLVHTVVGLNAVKDLPAERAQNCFFDLLCGSASPRDALVLIFSAPPRLCAMPDFAFLSIGPQFFLCPDFQLFPEYFGIVPDIHREGFVEKNDLDVFSKFGTLRQVEQLAFNAFFIRI